jgi:hypothetical protein
MPTGETQVQIAIGIVMIIAGPIALFFGDREIPVRVGIVLKIFERRPHPAGEEGEFSNWPYKYLFGGTLIVVGVTLVLKASKLM